MPSLGGPWFASRAGHPPPAKPRWWQVSLGFSVSCNDRTCVSIIRSFMFHHSTVPQPPKPYSEAPSWHLDASNGYARKTVAASASLANSAGKVISWIGGEKKQLAPKNNQQLTVVLPYPRCRGFGGFWWTQLLLVTKWHQDDWPTNVGLRSQAPGRIFKRAAWAG